MLSYCFIVWVIIVTKRINVTGTKLQNASFRSIRRHWVVLVWKTLTHTSTIWHQPFVKRKLMTHWQRLPWIPKHTHLDNSHCVYLQCFVYKTPASPSWCLVCVCYRNTYQYSFTITLCIKLIIMANKDILAFILDNAFCFLEKATALWHGRPLSPPSNTPPIESFFFMA